MINTLFRNCKHITFTLCVYKHLMGTECVLIVLEIHCINCSHCELFIKAVHYNIRSLRQVLRDQRTELRKIFDVRSIQTNGAYGGKRA